MSREQRLGVLREIKLVVTALRLEASKALNDVDSEKAEELNALADAWLCVDKQVRSQ